MDSIRGFVEIEYQKDLINQLLRQAFLNIPKERYEEMTELVFAKIHQMNSLRGALANSSPEVITRAAQDYGVTNDNVLDSFMYFALIVENSMLVKQLAEYIEKEGD